MDILDFALVLLVVMVLIVLPLVVIILVVSLVRRPKVKFSKIDPTMIEPVNMIDNSINYPVTNASYEAFASDNGFAYSDAQGQRDFKSYRRVTLPLIDLGGNEWVNGYAYFDHFPFKRRARTVMFLIQGNYRGYDFCAYTCDVGVAYEEFYGIIMVASFTGLDMAYENIFFENGCLVHYNHGYLDVNTVKPTLDYLITLTS